jgi:hypothetical protein
MDQQEACSVAGCDEPAAGVIDLSPLPGTTRPVPDGATSARPTATSTN